MSDRTPTAVTPRPLRQAFESLVCLAMAVALCRTFAVGGYMITTGSMAPSLLGYHRRVVCHDCGYEFARGASVPKRGDAADEKRDEAACPNCGLRQAADAPRNEGDQLLVHKHVYDFRAPRRWEVVVFRNPADAAEPYVKRVVGLPGETVRVRNGDVYVDGELQRKGLETQLAMRVPVYDSRHFAAERPQWENDGWRQEAAGAAFLTTQESGPATLRLRGRVTANCYYNRPAADDAASVRDVMWAGRVVASGGTLKVTVSYGGRPFDVSFDFDRRRASLSTVGAGPMREAVLPESFLAEGGEILVSVFDRQVVVALDGELVFVPLPFAEDASTSLVNDAAESDSTVVLTAAGGDIRLGPMRVYRDVYVTDRGRTESVALQGDEYFVLGDNSPVSVDSRVWPHAAVKHRALIGRPFVVHLPSRQHAVEFAGWSTRVRLPDVSRVRYIR